MATNQVMSFFKKCEKQAIHLQPSTSHVFRPLDHRLGAGRSEQQQPTDLFHMRPRALRCSGADPASNNHARKSLGDTLQHGRVPGKCLRELHGPALFRR